MIKKCIGIVCGTLLGFLIALSLAIVFALRPVQRMTDMAEAAGILEFPQFSAAPKKSEGRRVLRLVTYNIGYASGHKNNQAMVLGKEEAAQNLRAIADTLRVLQPDIVALQEVDFNSRRTFYVNQLAILAESLELPYAAYAVTWNKRYMPWPYWPLASHFGPIFSGQVVLSRYPIANQQVRVFAKPRENWFWYNWFYLDRVLQQMDIDLGDRKALLWHVHLEAFHKAARLRQAEQLGQAVAAHPERLKWVLGDFNSVSRIKPGLSLEQRAALEDNGEALRDIENRTGLANAETDTTLLSMPSWDPIKKIDHILYSEATMRVLRTGTVWDLQASDHLLIWADFELF